MKEFKVQDLDGLLLDWATLDAGAGGLCFEYTHAHHPETINGLTPNLSVWEPTSNGAQCWMLLESAQIIVRVVDGTIIAQADNGSGPTVSGPDHKTAVCQAYVASRRGATVWIPESITRFVEHYTEIKNEL